MRMLSFIAKGGKKYPTKYIGVGLGLRENNHSLFVTVDLMPGDSSR